MGADFLRRLLRPPALPPEVVEAQAELDRLVRDRPARTGPAAVLRELLPGLVPSGPVPAPPLSPDEARARRSGGVPLLRGEAPALDWAATRSRWLQVCAAVGRQQGGDAPRALGTAVRQGALDLPELCREVLAGRPEAVHARADALGLDSALTATTLRLTLLPELAPLHAAFAPLVEGLPWGRGCCPTCGSWPLLGEYRGLEQQRVLRCGLCGAGWEVPRLLCPFCANRDHRLLGYLGVTGEESRYRVTTCDACRGYVKMVTTLGPLSLAQVLVSDLATLHLDLAAADRGFAV
jgi:FdhE protein